MGWKLGGGGSGWGGSGVYTPSYKTEPKSTHQNTQENEVHVIYGREWGVYNIQNGTITKKAFMKISTKIRYMYLSIPWKRSGKVVMP